MRIETNFQIPRVVGNDLMSRLDKTFLQGL